MPTPNPDTRCPECGELLSEFGHCWQHHYPPMDPAQGKQSNSASTAMAGWPTASSASGSVHSSAVSG